MYQQQSVKYINKLWFNAPLFMKPAALPAFPLFGSLESGPCVIFCSLVFSLSLAKRGGSLAARGRSNTPLLLPADAATDDVGGPGDCGLLGFDPRSRSLLFLGGSSFVCRLASFTFFLLRTSWKPLLSVEKTVWSSSAAASSWSSMTTTPE